MMAPRIFFLSNFPDIEQALDIFRREGTENEINVITNGDEFRTHSENIKGRVILISFDNGLIVPGEILNRLDLPGYNFHPAPPEYPGRDPYHFAIYDGAKRYGATLHVMTEIVDAGPIVDVERFDVPEGAVPSDLLKRARDSLLLLLERHVPRLVRGEPLPTISENWGKRKTTREDFFRMCHLWLDIDREEFERRYRAFDGGSYDNLYLMLHGHRFRIEKSN